MGGPLTIQEIKSDKTYKYFVETGTYKGDTTLMASKHFQKVYTTEIMEELHNYSKNRAKSEGITNIEFMLGDSVDLLKKIVPEVKEGAVFFLDAHQSGGDTGNNGKNVPLLEELDIILSHNIGPSVFIVDDLRLWKSKVWDWAHISNKKIIQKFLDYGYSIQSFYEHNDRFFVLTK